MNYNKIISVIVPVYNTEQYIGQCIESIMNQTYREIELILVDDGSTDSSGSICDKYAITDTRIKVIHIENRGAFQARKVGALEAKGEYLAFSDSDDWLELDAFEKIEQLCRKFTPEIIAYAYMYENNRIVESLYDEKYYTKLAIQNEIINGMMFDSGYGRRRLDPSLCSKFIKRELYVSIANKVNDRITFGDDALIVYPAVFQAESMYITNYALYHYQKNQTSCTHKFPLERIIEVQAFQRNIINIFQEKDCYHVMQYQVEQYVRSFLQMMVKNWYDIDLVSTLFPFPYSIVPVGSKIVIYGAGAVGKSYVNCLKSNKYAEIAGWVDSNFEEMENYNGAYISSPEELCNVKYDFVLIAVFDKETAVEIRKHLMNYDVLDEKIIWAKPVSCY